MEAGTLSIRKIFSQDRRHIVPLYQRPYVWRQNLQWEPLWEDIRSVADRLHAKRAARAHFLGAIVLDQQRRPTGHLESRLVIDGQQRLTTIQMILEAFADICENQSDAERHHKALRKLVRNDDPLSDDPDDEFKVWPTNVDRDHFRRVMRAGTPQEVRRLYGARPNANSVGHSIGDAYLFFHDAITEWLNPADVAFPDRLETLYTTLRDYVRMVVIDLGEEDDAQVIFETLNARGTPLLPSDLVKNFLFHRAQADGEDLNRLYPKYWQDFDSDSAYWRKEVGTGHAKRARIDLYLQNYLTLKTRDEVSTGHLYTAFREFARNHPQVSASSHLEQLQAYSRIYQAFDRMPQQSRERLFFDRLATMDVVTAHPFLLELLARYGPDSHDTHAVLTDLESFLVRRMVCQLNTRGYGGLFVDMLNALTEDDGPAPERIRRFLMKSEADGARWPRDEEFREAWITAPLYRSLVQKRVRMLLEALELALRSELSERLVFGEALTVEHLMPQEWRKHWPLDPENALEQAELQRQTVIHSIGNLTLVTRTLNPTISNGPWDAKKSEILRHSALSLNRSLHNFVSWDEETIRARAAALYEVARRLWPRPAREPIRNEVKIADADRVHIWQPSTAADSLHSEAGSGNSIDATNAASSSPDNDGQAGLWREYWASFFDYVRQSDSPLPIPEPRGKREASFSLGVSRTKLHVALPAGGRPARVQFIVYEPNRLTRFSALLAQRNVVEAEIGRRLEWRELPQRKESQARLFLPDIDPELRDDWDRQFSQLRTTLEAFHRAFGMAFNRIGV